MANKKDYTNEELQKAVEEAKKNYEMLNEQLTIAKQEEEDRRKAQLALEKEARTKEVDEAYDNYVSLLNKYVEDYGSYSIVREHSKAFDPYKWWF